MQERVYISSYINSIYKPLVCKATDDVKNMTVPLTFHLTLLVL